MQRSQVEDWRLFTYTHWQPLDRRGNPLSSPNSWSDVPDVPALSITVTDLEETTVAANTLIDLVTSETNGTPFVLATGVTVARPFCL